MNSRVNPEKKQRKSLTLQVKLDVLKRLNSGQRQTDVCKALGLAGSTVRTIIKNADKIKEFGKTATPLTAAKLSRARSTIMVDMERLLSIWIEDQTQRRIPLSLLIIQAKARSLYESIKNDLPQGSNVEEFAASRGWFDRFKRRAQLHNVAVSGEAASADVEAAELFREKIKKIIEEEGYTSQQIFNVDETGLFWKRMPRRSYISVNEKSMPGFKASKDRLTLLLGGNAFGDFKLKPMLVYHSENPRALKGFSKGCLPVIWQANKKAWITRPVFDNWYTTYFCPAVKDYCAKNNLAHKALLLLDNAPGHPTNLDELSQHVKVVFLPPNTTSILQPMDQGVIATFKAYYIRRTFDQAVKATDGENGSTLKDFWKGYNIRHAITNIADSWQEVTAKAMNGVWRKLWSDCVADFEGFDDSDAPLQPVTDNIIELGRIIGLDNLEQSDIQELIESHEEELSDEDLIALEQQRAFEENDVAEDKAPIKSLTTEHLSHAFQLLEEVCEIFSENDPNIDRSSKVIRALHNSANCYKELLEEKKKSKKQMKLDSFFLSRVPSSTDDATASTSKD